MQCALCIAFISIKFSFILDTIFLYFALSTPFILSIFLQTHVSKPSIPFLFLPPIDQVSRRSNRHMQHFTNFLLISIFILLQSKPYILFKTSLSVTILFYLHFTHQIICYVTFKLSELLK